MGVNRGVCAPMWLVFHVVLHECARECAAWGEGGQGTSRDPGPLPHLQQFTPLGEKWA